MLEWLQKWGGTAVFLLLAVYCFNWTMRSCKDNKEDYKRQAYQQSTLHHADLSIWHHEKHLTDSTFMSYLIEKGFYEPEINLSRPEALVDFTAKQLDVLISKVPNMPVAGYSATFYQDLRKQLLIAGAIIRDPTERTAFIMKHYLVKDYNVLVKQLDYLIALLPSDYGSYPLRYIFALIDEMSLLYYFQHIGYTCGRNCRRTQVYPEKIAHFPDELLDALIKRYEERYTKADLTFTSSGTIYQGFKKAKEIKAEMSSVQ